MRQPIISLLLLVFFSFCWHASKGQKIISFNFEHGGVSYRNCSVEVSLVDQNGNPVGKSGDIKSLQLVFSNGNFGPEDPGSGLKMILKDDGLRLSGDNLKLDGQLTNGLIISGTGKKRRPIAVTGAGRASVRVNKLYCRTDQDDIPINVFNPATFEFEINGGAKSGTTPPPDAAEPPPPATPSPKQAPKNEAKKTEQDPAILAYNSAIKQTGEDRVRALKIFLAEYPTSARAKDAKEQVPLDLVRQKPNGDTLIYLVKYAACLPQFDTTAIKGIIEETRPGSGEFLLKVIVRSGESFDLKLTDLCKKKDFQITKSKVSGIPLQCVLDTTDTEFTLTFTGGTAPFLIEFLKDGQRFPRGFESIDATNKSYTFPKSLIRDKTQTHGIFTLQILEDNIISPLEGSVSVPPAAPLWPFAAGAVALLLAVALFAQLRRRARHKTVEAKMKKFEESQQADGLWVEPGNEPATTSTMKIRSTSRQATDPKALSENDFNALLKNGGYHPLQLRQQWPDTVLAEIHLSQKSIQGISRFLHEQRSTAVLDEQEGSIPEIGGFLLGKYSFSENTKQYRVLLEEFVPVTPEEHNVYQLHFSTESLVRELGDMQDEYPELSLVGWFHTHPGHGLFLSRPDLTIHDGFFKEKYQFAMEIDTMTPHLDTGFFSRTASGAVNNMETQAPETKWFHWADIEQQN